MKQTLEKRNGVDDIGDRLQSRRGLEANSLGAEDCHVPMIH
jgi:hypothetical protein